MKELDKYNIFDDNEIEYLGKVKVYIEEECISNLGNSGEIVDIIDNYIAQDDIIKKIKNSINISYIMKDLITFRRLDNIVDKKAYKRSEIIGGKESIFHENMYIYLGKELEEKEILLSEVHSNNERYDLYYYNQERNFSTIIELKTNNLSHITDNINQVEEYLINSIKKESIFMSEPDFGVLVIYNTGNKNIEEVYEKIKEEGDIKCSKSEDNIITVKNIEKPILILSLGDDK